MQMPMSYAFAKLGEQKMKKEPNRCDRYADLKWKSRTDWVLDAKNLRFIKPGAFLQRIVNARGSRKRCIVLYKKPEA